METIYTLREIDSPEELVDTIAITFAKEVEDKQTLLEQLNVEERYKTTDWVN